MADYEWRLGNTRDTIEAERAFSRRDRTTWENILHRNPNVGIEYTISGFGLDGTRTGTLWGSQAAGFLNGLMQAVDSGALVQQGSGRRFAHATQRTLTIEHFTAAQESWIRYELQFILTKKCDAAYEAEQLHSPSSLIAGAGVVIRTADDLGRSATDLRLHPVTHRDLQRKVNLGQAATAYGSDKVLQIYLNNKAFDGPSTAKGYQSLAEVLKHESSMEV